MEPLPQSKDFCLVSPHLSAWLTLHPRRLEAACARGPLSLSWHSFSMPTGGFHRAPLAKPGCKLSRAVLDSDKDGAKQVPPQGPQAQLHLHLFWGFGGFGAHHTLRSPG